MGDEAAERDLRVPCSICGEKYDAYEAAFRRWQLGKADRVVCLRFECEKEAERRQTAVDESIHGLWKRATFSDAEPAKCCECGAEIKAAEWGPYMTEALHRPASPAHGAVAWKCLAHHSKRRYEISATVQWYKGSSTIDEYNDRAVCFECGEKLPPGTPVFRGGCWPDRMPIGSSIARHVTCSPPKGALP